MLRERLGRVLMRSKIGMLLLLILLCNGLIGCATVRPESSVRPLEGDFAFVKKGDVITIAKDGAFCSDAYLSEILFVKAHEVKT